MSTEPLLLGIDVGTSKVAAVIVEPSGDCLASESLEHHADLPATDGRAEQDPHILLKATRRVVRRLEPTLRNRVRAIGLTGQMHGVVMVDEQCRPVGVLITWQDQRCDAVLLESLAERTGYRLCSGYGCATLAHLARHGRLGEGVACGSTIHDLLASHLVGAIRPVTDPTDAAGWGLFDLPTLTWDRRAAKAAKIDPAWLPEVVASGTCVGQVTNEAAKAFGIPSGVPVAAAIGDNQASLLATLANPDRDVGLTLGTGGQLSVVLPAGFVPGKMPVAAAFEVRPFPGGRYVAVASALCGGAAWQWLVDSIQRWLRQLEVEVPPREELYARVNELGMSAASSGLAVEPNFSGERHDAKRRGRITGVSLENFDLGTLGRALARGIVENLRGMLPAEYLAGRQRVVASGNAMRKNRLLRVTAGEVLKLPVVLAPSCEEAACGAAKNALGLLQ